PQNLTLSASAVAPAASLTVNWRVTNIGNAAVNAASTTVVRINQSATSPAGTDLATIATGISALPTMRSRALLAQARWEPEARTHWAQSKLHLPTIKTLVLLQRLQTATSTS